MFQSEGAGLQGTIPLSCGKTGKNEYFRVLKFSSFLRKRNNAASVLHIGKWMPKACPKNAGGILGGPRSQGLKAAILFSSRTARLKPCPSSPLPEAVPSQKAVPFKSSF